jgi:hypothetical protein
MARDTRGQLTFGRDGCICATRLGEAQPRRIALNERCALILVND